MTYSCIHDQELKFHKNHHQMIAHNNLASHPCILVSDIQIGTYYWQVVNFYNDTDNPSALNMLLWLDLDTTIPTLIIGDFNLHSHSWSPMGWATSSRAHRLEEWMATQTFKLLTKPCIPRRMGEGGAHNSTIDLAWCNMVALMQGTFFGVQVDFGGSVRLDHALIQVITSTPVYVAQAREDWTNRFNDNINTEAWEEWDCILRFKLPPLTPPHDPQAINTLVDTSNHTFNEACKAMMKQVRAAPGFNSRWWNDECWSTAKVMKEGFWTEEEQCVANRHLKKVVQEAKCNWVNEYITTADIWEVAAWRHSRCLSHIPVLLNRSGWLVYEHTAMATLLSKRFFCQGGGAHPNTL
jgi:hypothetical protein